ncbi:MAG: PilZ domain-containing protein [Candidatus Aminicenantes bacterium]|nr:MAG: PilZ domain-containing protein [Candidatus Aminicenantes bacterium]
MREERRKFLRFECTLPAELIKFGSHFNLAERATILDFSSAGLKLIIDYIHLNSCPSLEIKLDIPEMSLSTSIVAEVCWSKYVSLNRVEMGLRIVHMDKDARSIILNWIFPKWLEREMGERRLPEFLN